MTSKTIILSFILSSISLPAFAATDVEQENKDHKNKYSLFATSSKIETTFPSFKESSSSVENFFKRLFKKTHLKGVSPHVPFKKNEVIAWTEAKLALPFENIFTSKNIPPSDDSVSLKPSIKGLSYQSEEASLSLDQNDLPDSSFKVAKLLPSAFQEGLPSLLLPSEMLEGVTNNDLIGALALSGPVFRYLKHTPTKDHPQTFNFDLTGYERFSVKDNLARLGGLVTLRYNIETARMETVSIHYAGRIYTPHSEEWQHKQKIILATISTDITLIRQILYNQLLVGGTFSAITNHYLAPDHPIRVLLHSYQFKTLSINNKILPKLFKDKKSALYEALSFNQESLTLLLQKKAEDFYINFMDPAEELRDKNMSEILGKPGQIPYPAFLKRKMQIWELINQHIKEYLDIYYPNNTDIVCDNQIANWYRILGQCVPNGVSYYAYDLSKANVQALMTLFIYTMGVERHDLLNNFQLNNGVWQNLIPTQVPANPNSRSKIEVLHQYFKLLSQITPAYPTVGDDFSSIALDRTAQNKMAKFHHQILMLK